MKKCTYFLLCSFIVLWGTMAQAELKTKWSFGTEGTWLPQGLDLNRDGNNQIATRADLNAPLRGAGSGDGYYFFSTLLGANVEWSVAQSTSVVADIQAQFDWHGSNYTVFPLQSAVPGEGPGDSAAAAAVSQDTGNTTALGFGFKQLYLGFKDFLDFPIDLSIGRQNVKLGRGFVISRWSVGAGPTPYANGIGPSGSANSSVAAGHNGQVNGFNVGNLPLNAVSASALYAPERNAFDGFDAVRAKVHFDKLHFDLGYALIAGSFSEAANYVAAVGGARSASRKNIGARDDEQLLWLNGGYQWSKDLLTEAYFIANIDDEPTTDRNINVTMTVFRDKVYTAGGRADWKAGEFLGFKTVNPYVEGALQFGQLGGDSVNANKRKRQAYAANLGADFMLSSSSKWVPSTWTIEGLLFRGEETGGLEGDDGAGALMVGTNNKWNAWDWQFTGVEYALIMPYLDVFHLTDTLAPDAAGGLNAGKCDAGLTNRWVLRTKANFDLTKKWNLGLNLAYANAMQPPSADQSKILGAEVDWGLAYKFSSATTGLFDGGVFLPGTYYKRQPGANSAVPAYMLRLGFKVDLG